MLTACAALTMFQPQNSARQAVKPSPAPRTRRFDAILCPEGVRGSFIGSKKMGDTHSAAMIHVRILLLRTAHRDSWMGFTMEFPLGPNNENEGFGQCHECKYPESC